jgi:hypothetical protein
MQNNQKHLEEIHEKIRNYTSSPSPEVDKDNKLRFPYEFFSSIDRGWIPCDILKVDTEKELVKVDFYHPDASGWIPTCQGGVFDEVVEMWRVRLRES